MASFVEFSRRTIEMSGPKTGKELLARWQDRIKNARLMSPKQVEAILEASAPLEKREDGKWHIKDGI